MPVVAANKSATTSPVTVTSLSSTGVSKLEYASYLSACLAYLAHRQRDRVGIITFDDDVVTHVPQPLSGLA